MREILSIIATMCMSVASFAETIAIESTGHYVPLNDPEYVDLENGYELYPGYRRHISVHSMSGESESHWCYGTNILDAGILAGSELEFGAGYCTVLDEDGDAYVRMALNVEDASEILDEQIINTDTIIEVEGQGAIKDDFEREM